MLLVILMESQSRYSIVERLTDRKVQLTSQKFAVDDEIRTKEEALAACRIEFENWKKDIADETAKESRQKQQEIAQTERALANLRERAPSKKKLYEEQIAQVSDALASIEKISADAPTAREQAS